MTLSRSNPLEAARWFALGGTVSMMLLVLASAALASHPEVTLPGSNFEIDTDANLKLDDPAPSEDWASVPQGSGPGQERRRRTSPPAPATTRSARAPRKTRSRASSTARSRTTSRPEASEHISRSRRWRQVPQHLLDPRPGADGMTNMDFEFNKSEVLSANGVTPVRTAGDIDPVRPDHWWHQSSSCCFRSGSRPAATARPTATRRAGRSAST